MSRTRGGRHSGFAVALLLAASTAGLAGCSQVAAIAPVGGGRVADVRYATNDVLVAAGIPIHTAPVCTEAGDHGVTCEGSTVDGTRIGAVSTASDPGTVTVTVGETTLYSGDIQAVLEKAMGGS